MSLLVVANEYTAEHEPPRPFKMGLWPVGAVLGDEIIMYIFGTLDGIFRAKGGTLALIAVQNEAIGNGDFAVFMDYYEKMAQDMQLWPAVVEIENTRLYDHLISKRGYTVLDLGNSSRNLIKRVK